MSAVSTELIAVLVAVTEGQPRCRTIDDGTALPSGSFAAEHRSLQAGLRDWVEQQTHHPLGYVEQLYTFADSGRTGANRTISISYLGLTQEAAGADAGWFGWYRYFPWEDRRVMPKLPDAMEDGLRGWVEQEAHPARRAERQERLAVTFGLDGQGWNEELILQRYELLYEAALVAEAGGKGGFGRPMRHDHRRILATAIARLRAKIKYRALVFELMPAEFTLLQLQRSVEALAGHTLHKPNFRRLMAQQQLVEETGGSVVETGGRPARLYRFRRELLVERAIAGSKLPLARGN